MNILRRINPFPAKRLVLLVQCPSKNSLKGKSEVTRNVDFEKICTTSEFMHAEKSRLEQEVKWHSICNGKEFVEDTLRRRKARE